MIGKQIEEENEKADVLLERKNHYIKLLEQKIDERFDQEAQIREEIGNKLLNIIDDKFNALKNEISKESANRFECIENLKSYLENDVPKLNEMLNNEKVKREEGDDVIDKKTTELLIKEELLKKKEEEKIIEEQMKAFLDAKRKEDGEQRLNDFISGKIGLGQLHLYDFLYLRDTNVYKVNRNKFIKLQRYVCSKLEMTDDEDDIYKPISELPKQKKGKRH